jgi:Icc-related predicted phosphoesterase
MRIVAVSDTHNHRPEVPDGDVLVHAGDITFMMHGDPAFKHILRFREWLRSLPHKRKVFIAGNHDFGFQTHPKESQYIVREFDYLQDSGVEIDGVKFWGSPWQPWFFDWAFNLPRDGDELAEKWALVPEDTDVLVTHGPPYGYGDHTPGEYGPVENVGCKLLRKRLLEVKPRYHVCGHIHSGYGMYRVFSQVVPGKKPIPTEVVNASVCNEEYLAMNKPVVLDL